LKEIKLVFERDGTITKEVNGFTGAGCLTEMSFSRKYTAGEIICSAMIAFLFYY
jgi:hypothetical protein